MLLDLGDKTKTLVDSEEEKVVILQNVERLGLPSMPDHLKRIFIRPDREREVNKALRSKLAVSLNSL